MAEKDWWEIFKTTGCVMDYLSYKGINKENISFMQPGNKKIGEKVLESVSNSDRDDTVRSTYR